MSTVAEIQEAISRLSPQKYCELMAMLHPSEEDDWDRRMKTDAEGGKFATMNEKAEADNAAGPGDRGEGLIFSSQGTPEVLATLSSAATGDSGSCQEELRTLENGSFSSVASLQESDGR